MARLKVYDGDSWEYVGWGAEGSSGTSGVSGAVAVVGYPGRLACPGQVGYRVLVGHPVKLDRAVAAEFPVLLAQAGSRGRRVYQVPVEFPEVRERLESTERMVPAELQGLPVSPGQAGFLVLLASVEAAGRLGNQDQVGHQE